MTTNSFFRIGGLILIATGFFFGIAGILTAILPDGGLSSPAASITYYVGLILSTLAFIGIYSPQAAQSGKTGFLGFALAFFGAIFYSAPVYTLVAGTSGVREWHSVWEFAMGNILSLGATIFLLGMILLAVVTIRNSIYPRWAGILLGAGAFLWLIAFWGLSFLLLPANLMVAISMIWMGTTLLPRTSLESVSVT